ncbi:response regulator transcription factor [Flaviflexus huanghaiensis]|uniref:response regulator transcription factor n=1 Tax=Flaviflexus huanghaiensis TaxID=1111473 RepID=UPI0015FBE328|nr:response regulator transcription factor [Flaviflexus huanghaiensis]
MTKIFLVEDEAAYRDTLTFKLNRDGYDVVAVGDGQEAVDMFERTNPDIVLLDLMLPGLSGTEVCRQIRQKSSVPVIMLTAKDSELDKVVGLEIGADDYVTKPYSYRELVARIRAVLRRGVAEDDEVRESALRVGRVAMNTGRHEVAIDGAKVAMPLREFELLELFMRNADRVLTRAQIIDRIWGPDYTGDTKTLDVHVKRLRSKIEVEPSAPTMLLTVRGLGYKLVSD